MSKKIKCIVIDDEPMAREILAAYIYKCPNLTLIQSFKNASEALVFFKNNEVDVFFLDINMPDVDGLSLAKIVQNKVKVIFTTAYRDHALDAFNLNVVDYLLKPFSFDRFLEAISKISETKKQPEKEYIFLRSERKMVKIDFSKITFIESLSDYVKIHLEENKIIVSRENISQLEELLPKNNFLRIHRSFIVSIKKIQSFTHECIHLNKKTLPLSRSYKEAVLQKLG